MSIQILNYNQNKKLYVKIIGFIFYNFKIVQTENILLQVLKIKIKMF